MGILGILWGSIIPVFLVFLFIILKNTWLINFRFQLQKLKPSFLFGLGFLPISFLTTFEGRIDRVILERYLDLEQVGLYALLISVVSFFEIVVRAYHNAIRPMLYQALKNQDASTNRIINTLFNTCTSIGLLGLSGILLIGAHFHWITDSPKYLNLVKYFPYAIAATIPLIIVRFQIMVILFYKKTFYLSLVSVFKTLIMIGTMMLLIPEYGIYGAIGGLFISYILYFFSFKLVEKKLSVQAINLANTLVKISLFLAFLGLHLLISKQIGLSASSILVFLLTVGSLYFFERKAIHDFLKNKR